MQNKSLKTWLAFSAVWIIGSASYLCWKSYVMAYNVAAIVCWPPGTGNKTYPTCFASNFHKAESAIWPGLIIQILLWAILPPVILYIFRITAGRIIYQKRGAKKYALVAVCVLVALVAAYFGLKLANPPECDPHGAKAGEANIRACTAQLQSASLSNYDRAMALNIRGNNYDAMKQYDLAIADYTAVIKLRPDFEYGYSNRGLEKCRKEDCKDAIADYDQALRIDPKSVWARYGRGVARIRSGDMAGGQDDIAAANADDPEIASSYRQIDMTP